MNTPEWNYIEGEYLLDVGQGKGIIEEKGSKLYYPRIEDRNGNVITQFQPGFENFETADAFVRANMIELDRIETDEPAFHEKLAHTLDMCLDLLAEPSRVFHRLRLENIKRWILQSSVKVDTSQIPVHDWINYQFEWQQQNNQYRCETLHGKVTVTESLHETGFGFRLGAVEEYKIQIEDATGVILKDYYNPTLDFLDVENRVRHILVALEEPFVDEVYLAYLSFTLQICERLLPSDTHPMNYFRLSYIDLLLGESLP